MRLWGADKRGRRRGQREQFRWEQSWAEDGLLDDRSCGLGHPHNGATRTHLEEAVAEDCVVRHTRQHQRHQLVHQLGTHRKGGDLHNLASRLPAAPFLPAPPLALALLATGRCAAAVSAAAIDSRIGHCVATVTSVHARLLAHRAGPVAVASIGACLPIACNVPAFSRGVLTLAAGGVLCATRRVFRPSRRRGGKHDVAWALVETRLCAVQVELGAHAVVRRGPRVHLHLGHGQILEQHFELADLVRQLGFVAARVDRGGGHGRWRGEAGAGDTSRVAACMLMLLRVRMQGAISGSAAFCHRPLARGIAERGIAVGRSSTLHAARSARVRVRPAEPGEGGSTSSGGGGGGWWWSCAAGFAAKAPAVTADKQSGPGERLPQHARAAHAAEGCNWSQQQRRRRRGPAAVVSCNARLRQNAVLLC
eukprot:354406-Chlamydomonas_euryale.AAC.6